MQSLLHSEYMFNIQTEKKIYCLEKKSTKKEKTVYRQKIYLPCYKRFNTILNDGVPVDQNLVYNKIYFCLL